MGRGSVHMLSYDVFLLFLHNLRAIVRGREVANNMAYGLPYVNTCMQSHHRRSIILLHELTRFSYTNPPNWIRHERCYTTVASTAEIPVASFTQWQASPQWFHGRLYWHSNMCVFF